MSVLTPASEAELAEAVADAANSGAPLEVTGGGTRLALGRPVQAEHTVSVAGLSGISLYEPGALTLVAQAGTPLVDIEAALAAEGQMLPFEPMDHRPLLGTEGVPTIGGVVAVNAHGPRRLQKGAVRDSMIGVRFVDGQGQVIKNGGRVMKNVTGVDLVKLMAGQFGTLGVLSEVAFKVLPRPEVTGVLRIAGLSPERAVAAMSAALGSPYDVSAASHIAADDAGHPSTQLRVEGLEASVNYRMKELTELLSAFGAVEATINSDVDWSHVRDVLPFAGGEDDVWRMSVKPSDGPGIIERLPAGARWLMDWGGGLVWAAVAPGTDLRDRLSPIAGHATLIRAAAATRAAIDVFEPEPAPLARISAGLRAKFDPKGILNPGRMRA